VKTKAAIREGKGPIPHGDERLLADTSSLDRRGLRRFGVLTLGVSNPVAEVVQGLP
jgi:hypothetical protein